MRLSDDFEERTTTFTPTIVKATVAVTLFVAVILGVVLFLNGEKFGFGKTNSIQNQVSVNSNSTSQGNLEDWLSGSNLTPGDLEFWQEFPQTTEAPAATPVPTEAPKKDDPATDGKHTLIKYANGSQEWVTISQSLPKNTYDFTKLVCQSNLMKYYENGKKISYVGLDISEEQDYVDFAKVKKAGIDYVMLRVGVRGYGSGELIADEYFTDNIKRATNAGLDIGVYFFSQAITEAEAVEEANFVIELLGDYKISYPVALDMDFLGNDTARTDNLTKSERTSIAQAFLLRMQEAGYKTCLYGNKEFLIKKVDMSKLTAHNVWLSQDEDIPDYPYHFAMWQYDFEGKVDGIYGTVNMDVSFVKFSEK